jgi:carbon monoxide dehydrogenase subunit G
VRSRTGQDWSRRRRVPVATVDIADELKLSVPTNIAWERLENLPALAGFIPGFVPESFQQVGPTDFEGRIKATALGVTANWQMRANVRADAEHRQIAIQMQGTDSHLGLQVTGGADLLLMSGDSTSSVLRYSGQASVTGRLAAAGGPIINSVIHAMVSRFVTAIGEPEKAAQVAPTMPLWRRWLQPFAALLRGWRRAFARSRSDVPH